MSLNDDEAWAIESLGQFYLSQERYHRAAPILRALSIIRPDRPYSWYGLGLLHERGEDVETALRCFARAVEASRGEPAYVLHHAEALLRNGDIAAAEPLLDRVAQSETSLTQRATALRVAHGLREREHG